MAKVLVDGDDSPVSLSAVETREAVHGDVSVPRSSLVRVRVVPDGMDEVHGVRAPGTSLPHVVMVGTWRHPGGVTFAACHGRRPAVVLELTDAAFDRIVVTVDNPQETVAELS